MSAVPAMTWRPVFSTWRTVSARSSGVAESYATLGSGAHTSTTITSAPSCASRTASARPWPRAAPVTSATLPATRSPISRLPPHAARDKR